MTRQNWFPIVLASTWLLLTAVAVADDAAQPQTVVLVDSEGVALPVVTGVDASERTIAMADTLADYLTRMTGRQFERQKGDGSAGIVVGLMGDFEALPFEVVFELNPFNREQYVLRSAPAGLWLLGATDLAVRHAVWGCLFRLGHRQFFPWETWEVVPQLETPLTLAVDAREKPDFATRRMWYNWGPGWYLNQTPYHQWCARNRAVQGFNLNSGHSYGGIINRNRAEFEAHPEYGALVNGKRGRSKFCISNPDLRKLVVEDAKRRVQSGTDSISMDPSDGGGWCECKDCDAMGGISNRVLTLANEVAEGVNQQGFGDIYVGIYAYSHHCAPPTIDVHPKVIVSATTGFLTGGYTFEQVVQGWHAKGATMGVYQYFSVVAFDHSLPRKAASANPYAVAASIHSHYKRSVRFFDAESADAWGPYGLGFYVASRVLWDVDQADHVDEIIDDFLTRAFGPAKEPMGKFYHLITQDGTLRSNADLVGRMYRHLKAAGELAADRADVLRRIRDLILYTHYVELHNTYESAVGDAKAQAKRDMLRFAYRIYTTGMVHSYGLWSRIESQREAENEDHPSKSDEPVTDEEVQAMLTTGIAANQPVEVDFEMVDFSEDLVPAAAALQLPDVATGSYPTVPQDHHRYFVWVDKAPAKIHMKVTTQRVWNLRPHKITLFSPKDVHIKEVDSSDIVRPDGKTYDVILQTPHDGLHRIEIIDGGDYTRIDWPDDLPVTLPATMNTGGVHEHFRGAWSLYFYVPKGTKHVAGWGERIAQWAPQVSGQIVDATGKVQHDFYQVGNGWFKVPVPQDQDGKLWKFVNTQGVRRLVTVPSYFAVDGDHLLLPREVLQADAALQD